MKVETNKLRVRIATEALEKTSRAFEVDTKLRLLFSGRGVSMRLRIDIRIDAQCDAHDHIFKACESSDVLKLLFAFAIEEADIVGAKPLTNCVHDLLVGLADTCIDATRSFNSRSARAKEFATTHDIHTCTSLAECAEDAEVCTTLH